MLYLSEIPFFFLIAGKGKTAFLCSFLIFLFLLFLLWKSPKTKNADIAFPFLTALIALAAGVLFYMRWNSTGRMASAAVRLNLPPKQLAGILASLLSTLSVRGIDAFIGAIFVLLKINPKPLKHNTIGIIFILAAAVITISSKSSPLYPFNDWSDSNTMFTIGKAVLRGKVPYRDLFEQKGPILIFAHTLGAAISYFDLHGMWVIEILCAFGFLYWNEKILRNQFRETALSVLPFLAFFAYTPISFQKGDSAEEFALPFLAYAFFVLVSTLWEDRLPTRKEWLFSGTAFAVLFWVKFTLVAPFAGWLIPAVCSFREKRFKAFLKGVGVFFCGFLIVTLPILIYFGTHNALGDLFECYFYDNIFLYPQLSSIWENFRMGFGNIWTNSALLVIAAAAGLLWCGWHERNLVFWALLCSVVFTFSAIYCGGRTHAYYSLVFASFAVFGCCWIGKGLETLKRVPRKWGGISLVFLSAAAVFCFSENVFYLRYEKKEIAQYRVKEVLEQSGIENPTLLNYLTLDCGYNTTAGLVPEQRFYFSPTAPVPHALELQRQCLEEGCVDFFITFMGKQDFPLYEFVGTYEEFTDKTGQINQFHLYRRSTE